MVAEVVGGRVAAGVRLSAEGRMLTAMIALVAIIGGVLLTATHAAPADVAATIARLLAVTLMLAAMLIIGTRFLQRRLPPHERLAPERIAMVVGAALLVGLTIPVFGIFKQFVLPLRGFPLDATLAAIGRTLFLGNIPWQVTHGLMPGPVPMLVFDRLYTAWMPMMVAFPMIVAVGVRSSADRIRLIGCWLAAWIVVGGIGAWLLGSAGPVYYSDLIEPHPGFSAFKDHLLLQAEIASAAGYPIAAIEFQPLLLEAYRSGLYAPAGGISAAPSMHVAMAALFAIGGFRINRALGIALTVFAVAIWIGSFHLGWHYAVDGLISVPLVWGLWRASGRLLQSKAAA